MACSTQLGPHIWTKPDRDYHKDINPYPSIGILILSPLLTRFIPSLTTLNLFHWIPEFFFLRNSKGAADDEMKVIKIIHACLSVSANKYFPPANR